MSYLVAQRLAALASIADHHCHGHGCTNGRPCPPCRALVEYVELRLTVKGKR